MESAVTDLTRPRGPVGDAQPDAGRLPRSRRLDGLKHRVSACDLQPKILIRHFGVDRVFPVSTGQPRRLAGPSFAASVASAH